MKWQPNKLFYIKNCSIQLCLALNKFLFFFALWPLHFVSKSPSKHFFEFLCTIMMNVKCFYSSIFQLFFFFLRRIYLYIHKHGVICSRILIRFYDLQQQYFGWTIFVYEFEVQMMHLAVRLLCLCLLWINNAATIFVIV